MTSPLDDAKLVERAEHWVEDHHNQHGPASETRCLIEDMSDRLSSVLRENERIAERLRRIITAWESLPAGFHSRNEVQIWLNFQMKPAIDEARAALDPIKPDEKHQ